MDVKDFIRCKCVSKSWNSLISSPRFIKTRLKHVYNKHGINNNHTRLAQYMLLDDFIYFKDPLYWYLIGSSNGLVCIRTIGGDIVVAHPCTREVKKLPILYDSSRGVPISCCGFGYD